MVNQQTDVSQAVNTEGVTIKYAGFWIRWVAAVIDGFVVVIACVLINVILMLALNVASDSSILTLINILVPWIYYVTMTNAYQATLGKKAVGIEVVSKDGSTKVSLGRLIVRETIGKFVSAMLFMIGYLMAAFTSKKQALHDKFVGSVVIYKNPNAKSHTTVVVVVVVVAVVVMIAIFGIMSSIVLASLNTARAKGNDAAIKSQLTNTRPQGEIYYDLKGNYGVSNIVEPQNADSMEGCAKVLPSTLFSDPNISTIVADVAKVSGSVKCAVGPAKSNQMWALSAQLKYDPTMYWCVDSSGVSKLSNRDITAATCSQ